MVRRGKSLLDFGDLDLFSRILTYFQGHKPMKTVKISISITISSAHGWILTKLAQKHYWEEIQSLLDFGDLDLIFKVTSP